MPINKTGTPLEQGIQQVSQANINTLSEDLLYKQM
jgi:hypothetical protein